MSNEGRVIRGSGLVDRPKMSADESRITNLESLSAPVFTWPIRVYWEDTDAGGIVYYANYLKFMERARTEWLRALGVEQSVLQHEHGLIFVVVDTQVEFKKPARYGDALQVTARVTAATRATFSFTQEVHRDAEVLVVGALRAACLDAKSYKPRGLPQMLTDKLDLGRM